MDIDKKFLKEFITVTQQASIATLPKIGKKDKNEVDKLATDAMRKVLNNIEMKGRVVIGEGEIDEAPMLYIGEILGNNDGPEIDIAVDPLEGTNFAANNLPGALSVIAVSYKNNLLNAPETYMNKIAYGSDIEKGVIDLDYDFSKNIKNLAEFKNKKLEDITICILDRPRHKKIIEDAKKLKLKTKLISDGDVSGALLVTDKKYDVDLFLGIGGGPEGVLAACALDAYNCGFQGRFIFDDDIATKRAKDMGIVDLKKKYELKDIVRGDSIFCATGITNGELVKGIETSGDYFMTDTFVTHKSKNIKKNIQEKVQKIT
ncbi:class II fructose-bisphosphatase [Candidatus Pelagibacter sp.]|nr:class II fructose-bisphosphatase [Candidatus Pelagibacter sp.]